MARLFLIAFTSIIGGATVGVLCATDNTDSPLTVTYFLGVIAVCFLALCKLM